MSVDAARAAQVASPMQVWGQPADTYVAGFIGSPAMNFLAASLAMGGAGATLKAGPTEAFADAPRLGAEGEKLTIGIRPEAFTDDEMATAIADALGKKLTITRLTLEARLYFQISLHCNRNVFV